MEKNKCNHDKENMSSSIQENITEKTILGFLKDSLANVLYTAADEIDSDKKFVDLGLDSIIAVEWIKSINDKYGLSLIATKVYDFPSINEFTRFLKCELGQTVKIAQEEISKNEAKMTLIDSELELNGIGAINERSKIHVIGNIIRNSKVSVLSDNEPIAIVGMSGRYPDASNLDEFWNNLICSKNSIKEIPQSRWDVNQYYDPDPSQSSNGKIYAKWLGLMDDIEEFDTSFFQVSPIEAETIDPQQRLFLQEAYRAFEDAGYSPDSVSNKKCGVYLGIMGNDYQHILAKNKSAVGSVTSNSFAIAAARVAYFLNLKGPAISIDTACSSSLVSTHLAVQALQKSEIDMALVGGATLYLIPDVYIGLCAAEMLSPDGQCKTFDHGANGLVPGEGIGAIVLKRLSDAERDNDHIYGIIIGSGINQDGKTNGITAPSVKSQMDLEREIYNKYSIEPRSVSYVEMHGTGTKLGDPIELEALSTVYKEKTDDKNYCAIGSVKTNIGHTSAASGVASIQKVLLCLQHGKLVPTINYKQPNEHFNFVNSPFYVNTEYKDWLKETGKPRRSAISSFGFSGTNAHLIIEEYQNKRNHETIDSNCQVLIVLSARTPNQLREYAEKIVRWAKTQDNIAIRDFAYTLQKGRREMDFRLTFLSNTLESIVKNLDDYLIGNVSSGILTGTAKDLNEALKIYGNEEDAKMKIAGWIEKNDLNNIANAWVKGIKIDWELVYNSQLPNRISIPTYPFEKKKYWLKAAIADEQETAGVKHMHPLVQENTSNFTGQRFSSIFTGKEFFISDYTFNYQKLMPGIASLEMATIAFNIAMGTNAISTNKEICFSNVIWANQLVFKEKPIKIEIGLATNDCGEVVFEIYSQNTDGIISIHCQGIVKNLGAEKIQSINVHDYLLRNWPATLFPEMCYSQLREANIDYGIGYRAIEKISFDKDEAWVKVALPIHLREKFSEYNLHPSILEAALQAIFIVEKNRSANTTIIFPSRIEEIKILGPCEIDMWVHVKLDTDTDSFSTKATNINFYNSTGNLCVSIKGFFTNGNNIAPLIGIQKQKIELKNQINVTEEEIADFLCTGLADMLYVKPSDINIERKFIDMGIDSIIAVEWVRNINRKFAITLKAPIIYDFPCVNEFVRFIFKEVNKGRDVKPEQQSVDAELSSKKIAPTEIDFSTLSQMNVPSILQNFKRASKINSCSESNGNREKIAIIGISGKYPDAEDLESFWKNLVDSKSSIKEIPLTRWDVNKFFDKDPSQSIKGKIYAKWLGMIENVDEFDPLFFSISPAEAESLDPQQRLFLQEAYKAFEDAGYGPNQLDSKKCGVYLGIMNSDYELIHNQENSLVTNVTGSSFAIAAARISYFLNLNGPAIPIDTACSSSLVATYLATQALQNREIEMALVGGITLYLSPSTFIGMCAAGMLSPDGQCKTFDNSADGFVPGEGVGAVVLKRLSDAERDHDHIYGVIIGSGVNQDGKTNGITAPSMKSQMDLEREVYEKYRINPESISYVEMHGTGTKLGDPIELDALSNVFKEKTNRKNYCAIGSVKTNIGHTSAAAGLASLHKVLFCLKNHKLVPSLNFINPNEHFNFSESPFYVNTDVKDWQKENDNPHRAAISSFGFSGTNAHIVIEEYQNKKERLISDTSLESLIVLSARTDKQLKEYAEKIANWLRNQDDVSIKDLAYTLQIGRQEMEYRFACLSDSKQNLLNVLNDYLTDSLKPEYFVGEAKNAKKGAKVFSSDEDAKNVVEKWIEKNKLKKIGEAWVQGFKIDWELLYKAEKPHRISLPTYPFLKGKYWLNSNAPKENANASKKILHPMLHENVSDLSGLRFASFFSGKEFFISEHKTFEKHVLTGVAFLEMVRVALENVTDKNETNIRKELTLKNILWANPLIFDGNTQKIDVALCSNDNSEILFEFSTNNTLNDRIVHCQGIGKFSEEKYEKSININETENQRWETIITNEDIVTFCKTGEIFYTNEYLALEKIYASKNEALAIINIPSTQNNQFSNYKLHPAILDAALLGSAIYLESKLNNSESIAMLPSWPKSIDNVHIVNSCTQRMWVLIRIKRDCDDSINTRKIDIDLYNDNGKLCIQINGLEYEQRIKIQAEPILQKQKGSAKKEPLVFEESVRNYFIQSLSRMLFIEPSDINPDQQFIDLGMDSIISVEWMRDINQKFGTSFRAPIIYENPTIREFAKFIAKEINKNEVNEQIIDIPVPPLLNSELPVQNIFLPEERLTSILHNKPNFACIPQNLVFPVSTSSNEPIAIVGMSGKYPGADNLEIFWDNLAKAKNCIKEIPRSRWDIARYFSNDPNRVPNGKIYSKWLGMLENVEEFDPLFFNIAPVDAELMDPQQRIFLQEAYKAFEDAGCSPSSLSNAKCGVYLGIMNNDYSQIHCHDNAATTNVTANSFAIAAARISYFLNLKGPAIPIDTACSSSLVAAHLASQALLNNEIDMALVGGITLYLSPASFIGMCAAGMLSRNGQCKTFDNLADGFVPGEGAGAIVLKRLSDACKNKDNIYGVIIGSGINQDGKTNGITAPSMKRQMELEREIYEKYAIHPESISYVEMHGTGTKLGDPIELEALSSVYKEKTNKKNYCAIGSVKTNIGHTSAAAGVASIQKILLCMKNGKLVPTINYQKPNEHFDFDNSPFYVNTNYTDWHRQEQKPLRAAVSSFGFSGTNAHLVIEEYIEERKNTIVSVNIENPVIVVLSAKNKERLQQKAIDLLAVIEEKCYEDSDLADVSYTLQVGRDAMAERIGFVAETMFQVKERLKSYINNTHDIAEICCGQSNRNNDLLSVFEDDEDLNSALNLWIEKRKYRKVLELWVKGFDFDWDMLYANQKPRKISLPGYPFSKEKYWLALNNNNVTGSNRTEIRLHPFLQENTSDLAEELC